MQIKVHDSYRKIVALSDVELLGKTFAEGIKQIEIRANFFKGDKKSREQIIRILEDINKEDAMFNIVGKKSVQVALEAGVISKEGIITIQGVPIALGLL